MVIFGHYSWQAASGPANTCEVCHPSHELIASAQDRLMNAVLIEL
jgi:hypothetical protein